MAGSFMGVPVDTALIEQQEEEKRKQQQAQQQAQQPQQQQKYVADDDDVRSAYAEFTGQPYQSPTQSQYSWYNPNAAYGRVSNGNGGYTGEYTFSHSAQNLQAMLNTLARQYGDKPIAVDGYYGPETAARVQKYLGVGSGAANSQMFADNVTSNTQPTNTTDNSPASEPKSPVNNGNYGYYYDGRTGNGETKAESGWREQINNKLAADMAKLVEQGLRTPAQFEQGTGIKYEDYVRTNGLGERATPVTTPTQNTVNNAPARTTPASGSINDRLAANMASLVEQGLRTPAQFEQATGIPYSDYSGNNMRDELERMQSGDPTLAAQSPYNANNIFESGTRSMSDFAGTVFNPAETAGSTRRIASSGIPHGGVVGGSFDNASANITPAQTPVSTSINNRLAENMASLVQQGLRTEEQFKQATGIDFADYISGNISPTARTTPASSAGSPNILQELISEYEKNQPLGPYVGSAPPVVETSPLDTLRAGYDALFNYNGAPTASSSDTNTPASVNDRLMENMANLVMRGERTEAQFEQAFGITLDEYLRGMETQSVTPPATNRRTYTGTSKKAHNPG